MQVIVEEKLKVNFCFSTSGNNSSFYLILFRTWFAFICKYNLHALKSTLLLKWQPSDYFNNHIFVFFLFRHKGRVILQKMNGEVCVLKNEKRNLEERCKKKTSHLHKL